MNDNLHIILIGSGKWGQNYIKTIARDFPNIELTVANRQNWRQLIKNGCDGVIIATPPDSHIEIAAAVCSLQNAPGLMIEKPLSLSLTEAQSLLKLKSGPPILVNHIHLFAKDYQNIKKHINPNEIRQITLVAGSDSPTRSYSRLWDYAPHDIAMALDLAQERPRNIYCYRDNSRYVIKIVFDRFDADIDIWHAGDRKRILDINNGQYIYDGMKSTDLPLTNAIQVFIDAIHGKPDYRLGLDLPMQVMMVLDECQRELDIDQSQ